MKKNPLENIGNTRNVLHTVVKGEEVFDTQKLLGPVEGKLGFENAEDLRRR